MLKVYPTKFHLRILWRNQYKLNEKSTYIILRQTKLLCHILCLIAVPCSDSMLPMHFFAVQT